MLSAFKRAVDYLWNGEDIQSDSEEDDECDVNVGSNLKTLSGKISHVYSGHGLINDEIYFRFEDVLGGVRPSVGDEVSVVSKRQQSESGWKAVQVTPLLDWLEGCPEYNQNSPSPLTPASHWDGSSVDPEPTETETKYPQAEAIIGKVSGFTKETGFINETVPFKQDGCLNGFLPCTGDWVKANVTTTCPDGSDMAQVASEIAPLRTFQFEGEITAVMNDHGFIEANTTTSIFFYTGAFVGPDFPQKNDSVRGTAVESAQGQCVWRAIEVCPVFNPFPCERVMNPSSGDPVDARYLQDLCSNKHGVHVTGDVKFGTVAPGEVKVQTVWVKNHGAHPQALLGCEVWGQSSLFSVKSIKLVFEHPIKTGANDKRRNINISANEKAVLYPAMGLYLNVACEPRYIGSEFQLLVLQFEGFCIGRRLSVTVTDPHQVHIEPVRDSSSGDHGNRRSKAWNRARGERGSGWVVPGQRPSNRFRQTLPHRLPQFSVTEELESCVYDREDVTHICPRLAQDLDSHIYASKFHTLLHLEEIQMNIDIREFDLERVSLRPVGQFLALSVPGLAEGRPSVLIGDKVTVSEPGQGEGLCYEGYVHEVLSEDLLLKFHESFHQRYNREDYDVVFSFNRSTLRRCHQACDLALQLGEEVLFPKNVRPKLPQWVPCCIEQKSKKNHEILSENSVNYGKSEETRMTFLNAQLNKRQREAVVRIVLGQARPTPYILFGPPGTGKTVTVVEAVLQIFLHCTHSRVLVCTPSNSAADLIAERVHQSGKVTTSDMVRINALQRSEESIPECIRRYCYTEESLGLVSRYRIIVCTCSSAGLLLSLGLRVGHITHVFVDEAGQATEPECLIPVSLIAGADGQIVLAGDPHQLGPVLCSKLAKLYGLELSYLERLTQLPLYQRDVDKYSQQGGYNPLLVTKLTDNYRSHESLLSLPSRLFYDDELSVKADLSVTHSMTGWPHLPTVGFPLIFHGVQGEDMREGNSPSWFNPMETVQVIRYLQMLFTDDGRRVTTDQVGVITAYRKQVEKIRLLMDRLGVPAVKVGSVEEFQGQERKVIIISTVRSTETLVGFDERHHLGFLSNRKRFNVAITRAQALLIVIGNPFVLAEDVYWRSLIRFASDSGGYTGCDLPDLESCQNGVANIS